MKIICLCGSTRYGGVMAVAAWEIEKSGDIALGWHLLPNWYKTQGDHIAEQEGVAEILDRVHFEKIRMADTVLIINCEGYIGKQTQREIEFAKSLGKPIVYLEQPEDKEET